MSGGVATEMDRRIATALKATAGSTTPLAGSIRRLNSVHESLKSQLATGLLTEAEYAKEAGGLLNILSNFDGPFAEVASTSVIGGLALVRSLPELN
jgi:hypothetical protein